MTAPTSPAPRPAAPRTIDGLLSDVLAGAHGPDPAGLTATSAFWIHHGTRLAGGDTTYLNQYVLIRLGGSFGACAFEPGEVDPAVCREASGTRLDVLLREAPRPIRIAALDAYLTEAEPHSRTARAERVVLPAGTPETRAKARDAAVAGLLDIAPGAKVGLIGVVNPLVAAIRERGGSPLLCDFNLRTTRWGDPVSDSAETVLAESDAVVATGMTLGNGTFDTVLARCRERAVPLIVYSQTGSAVARAFLGSGVTALSAEPFPFSQFSAEPTTLYRYRAAVGDAPSAGVGA